MEFLKENFTGQKVSVVLDCCYAGSWCEEAENWYTEGNRANFEFFISAFSSKDSTLEWNKAR